MRGRDPVLPRHRGDVDACDRETQLIHFLRVPAPLFRACANCSGSNPCTGHVYSRRSLFVCPRIELVPGHEYTPYVIIATAVRPRRTPDIALARIGIERAADTLYGIFFFRHTVTTNVGLVSPSFSDTRS
jgi:hypothetical protein